MDSTSDLVEMHLVTPAVAGTGLHRPLEVQYLGRRLAGTLFIQGILDMVYQLLTDLLGIIPMRETLLIRSELSVYLLKGLILVLRAVNSSETGLIEALQGEVVVAPHSKRIIQRHARPLMTWMRIKLREPQAVQLHWNDRAFILHKEGEGIPGGRPLLEFRDPA